MAEEQNANPAPAEPNELITRANLAAERLEKANEDFSKLLLKQEAMRIETTFGGKTEAGSQEPTAEEKEIDDARRLIAGTGFEDDLFPRKQIQM